MKLSIFESYGKKELQQQQSEKHEVEHEHDEPKKPKFTISSALPFGWEKYSTHGMDYFQNHKRHLFSFQDPRENIVSFFFFFFSFLFFFLSFFLLTNKIFFFFFFVEKKTSTCGEQLS